MPPLANTVINPVPAEALTVGALVIVEDELAAVERVQHGTNGRTGARLVRVTVHGVRLTFNADDLIGVATDGLF